jgi:hypothetical protein
MGIEVRVTLVPGVAANGFAEQTRRDSDPGTVE